MKEVPLMQQTYIGLGPELSLRHSKEFLIVLLLLLLLLFLLLYSYEAWKA